jgi:hypothetical protein
MVGLKEDAMEWHGQRGWHGHSKQKDLARLSAQTFSVLSASALTHYSSFQANER